MYVCLWVCGCDFSTIKTKTHDQNDMKLGKVVVLNLMSKPIFDFGFKRPVYIPTAYVRAVAEPTMKRVYHCHTPTTYYCCADVHLHRVHFPPVLYSVSTVLYRLCSVRYCLIRIAITAEHCTQLQIIDDDHVTHCQLRHGNVQTIKETGFEIH